MNVTGELGALSVRKELSLAIVAVALAVIVVQSASFLQNPPTTAVTTGESVMEPRATLEASRPTSIAWYQTLTWSVLGPLAVAVLCYTFVRRRT